MQSKKGSFIEACINTLIGFLISLAANPLFCWLFNVKMNGKQMVSYILAFTVLSVLRSYIIRRYFNGVVHKAVERALQKKQNENSNHIPLVSLDRRDLLALADQYGVATNPTWNNERIKNEIETALKNIKTY